MNFIEAVRWMREGKTVREVNTGSTYVMEEGLIVDVDTDDEGDIVELVDATFEVVDTSSSEKLFAVFSPEKNRWVSTVEPEKHKAAGKRVAVFTYSETV